MDNQLKVKVGDTLAVLSRGGVFYDGPYKPAWMGDVVKITPKRIYLKNHLFDREGNPVDHMSRFARYRLTDDKAIIDTMLADKQARVAAAEESERQKAERDARPTYQLARELTGWQGTDEAVADLELLGETRLRRILSDIAKAKELHRILNVS